jgi:hypothetical protein
VRARFVNEDYSGKQYVEFTTLLEEILKLWRALEPLDVEQIQWYPSVEGVNIQFPMGYSKEFYNRVEELLKKNRIAKFDESEPFQWEWRPKEKEGYSSDSLILKPY